MALNITNEEIFNYRLENANALTMIEYGINDYIAARCLLLNCLFPGFVLAAQVEKYLKGYILLFDKDFNPKRLSHGILSLEKMLHNYQDVELNYYLPLFVNDNLKVYHSKAI